MNTLTSRRFSAALIWAAITPLAACVDLIGTSDGSASAVPQDLQNAQRVSAALKGGGAYSDNVYLFHDSRYRRMEAESGEFNDDGSLPTFAFHLPSAYHAGFDAALAGGGGFADKGYFFLGPDYARYDWASNSIDTTGSLSVHWGLPAPFSAGIDAAVNGEGIYAGKAYFFKGDQYLRYDWATGAVDPGYPAPLAYWNLPAPFSSGVDSVVPWPQGSLTFIRDNSMVTYNWSDNSIGLVQAFPATWQAALDAAPTRRVVLYATIDPVFEPENHSSSIAGLQGDLLGYHPTASSPWPYVDPWWGNDVTAEMLADPHVMAVVSSGSFTEWFNMHEDFNPAWGQWVSNYASRLWEANVPFLAVCGSHQLISGARAGWSSVRHMAHNGIGGVSIATELLEGVSYVPPENIRPSERGLKPIAFNTNEALFGGLPSPATFYLSHADEVIDGAFPFDAVRIATRAAGSEPFSTVQALKYTDDVHPGRIAYSTQFHPEVDDSAGAHDGHQLIRNFANLAVAYWATH